MGARKKPTSIPPKQFFEVACPRVLSILRATCAELGGRYGIDVAGAGAWTLDFPNAAVVPGVDSVDLTLHLDAAQFASLSSAKVELKKLVADGTVRVDGDVAKIENVSLVLAFMAR